jgi:SAM-dependent methyltransferase
MDQDKLAALYRNRFPQQELERKAAIWEVLCRHYFQRFVPPGATVVDLACGYGEFINHIDAGEKVAVDLNGDSRSRLAADVRFEQISALEIASLGRGSADLVFTSNFLEHLPDRQALEQLLDQLLEVLRPGGRFLVLGPNLRYLPGAYWDFYDHTLGLTHLSLCEVLALKGFGIETCIDRFLPYTTRGALPTHPALVRAYLAVPLAWRLLGRQFFVAAKTPSRG